MSTDGRHTAIFGKTGSGKSTLARAIVKPRPRVIVFDPKARRVEWAGYEPLEHFGQFAGFLGDMDDGHFRVYYAPEASKREARLSSLCRLLMHWNRRHNAGEIDRPVTLLVDELADVFPNHAGVKPGMQELCQKGRSYGISVVGISQRPARVHPDFRSNCANVAAFKFGFPADVAAICEAMEDAAVEAAIKGLSPYEFVAYDDAKGWKVEPPVKV